MESTILIKVKYGETLRRFHALLLTCEYGLDMDGLRAKICSLFNLPSNSDLKTTYIDEDGDVVTLVDDDDLYDIIRQKLKFLRIDVELSDKMNNHPYSGRRITGDSPAQPTCHDYSQPIFGGNDFLREVNCDGCGTLFTPELHSKSTGQENLDLCPMCCTKIRTENDSVRTTYQSGCRKELPSSRVVHNQNPGLDPRAGEHEQNGCLTSNDSMRGTPFLASRVENREEGFSREANLLDKLPKNCQRFPATPAVGTSTESHPVAWDKKLPAVSLGAPPLFENGSDHIILEIRLREMEEKCLREMEEKCLRRVNYIRNVLSTEFFSKCLLDPFDQDKWDAALYELHEMGFSDMPMVEMLLVTNNGNMKRTVLELLAREKA